MVKTRTSLIFGRVFEEFSVSGFLGLLCKGRLDCSMRNMYEVPNIPLNTSFPGSYMVGSFRFMRAKVRRMATSTAGVSSSPSSSSDSRSSESSESSSSKSEPYFSLTSVLLR